MTDEVLFFVILNGATALLSLVGIVVAVVAIKRAK